MQGCPPGCPWGRTGWEGQHPQACTHKEMCTHSLAHLFCESRLQSFKHMSIVCASVTVPTAPVSMWVGSEPNWAFETGTRSCQLAVGVKKSRGAGGCTPCCKHPKCLRDVHAIGISVSTSTAHLSCSMPHLLQHKCQAHWVQELQGCNPSPFFTKRGSQLATTHLPTY